MNRRTALRGIGAGAGIVAGGAGLYEAGEWAADQLGRKCDWTDTVTMREEDAVIYKTGNDMPLLYVEYSVDREEGMEPHVYHGPLGGLVESVDLAQEGEQLTGEHGDVEFELPSQGDIPYVHVDPGDVVTGGDVVEPRAMSSRQLTVSFPEEVCVRERGESDEYDVQYRAFFQ